MDYPKSLHPVLTAPTREKETNLISDVLSLNDLLLLCTEASAGTHALRLDDDPRSVSQRCAGHVGCGECPLRSPGASREVECGLRTLPQTILRTAPRDPAMVTSEVSN